MQVEEIVIWGEKRTKYRRISRKLARMVQAMYKGSKCAVIDGGGKTGWFDIKSGVRQGCVMSGFLFLLVIDWMMRKTLSEGNTGRGYRVN